MFVLLFYVIKYIYRYIILNVHVILYQRSKNDKWSPFPLRFLINLFEFLYAYLLLTSCPPIGVFLWGGNSQKIFSLTKRYFNSMYAFTCKVQHACIIRQQQQPVVYHLRLPLMIPTQRARNKCPRDSNDLLLRVIFDRTSLLCYLIVLRRLAVVSLRRPKPVRCRTP